MMIQSKRFGGEAVRRYLLAIGANALPHASAGAGRAASDCKSSTRLAA